jgi:hypothetical protein
MIVFKIYRLVLETNHPFLVLKRVSGNYGISHQRRLILMLPICNLFIKLGTVSTGIRPENPRELTGKMFQNSGFITSHLKNFLKMIRNGKPKMVDYQTVTI